MVVDWSRRDCSLFWEVDDIGNTYRYVVTFWPSLCQAEDGGCRG